MSFTSVHLGSWILWALSIANASVFAATISNPLEIASQLAKATDDPVRIEKFEPSPALQRQFEIAEPKPRIVKVSDDHLLTERYSFYNVEVTDTNIALGIRHNDDTRLPALDFKRLLRKTMIFCSALIDISGRDFPMNTDYTDTYPPVPGLKTIINISRLNSPYGHMTYGVALDALRGIQQFKKAYPTKNGELVALIRTPRVAPPHPERWGSGIGYINFFDDDEQDVHSGVSAGS
ncbi:MAG: hypothetical protein Q9216_005739 [Gyalolechia sp. 2 TL-2023]